MLTNELWFVIINELSQVSDNKPLQNEAKQNKKVVDKRLQVRYNKQAVAKRQQTGTLIIEQQPSLKIQK